MGSFTLEVKGESWHLEARFYQRSMENHMSDIGGISSGHLKSFVERIERLEEEKAGVAEQIREVFAEAKGTGFDIKVMRQILKIRKMEEADRAEQEELLDLYLHALGMAPQDTRHDVDTFAA